MGGVGGRGRDRVAERRTEAPPVLCCTMLWNEGEWTPSNGGSSGSSVASNGVTVNTTYDTVKQSPGKSWRRKESSVS